MQDNEIKRLTWQCRRGMLELDIFLNRFLQEVYSTLDQADKQLFINLLSCTDQDLFIWLTGREDPQDSALLKIVKMVREHVNPLSCT